MQTAVTVKTGAAAVSRVARQNPMELLVSLVEGDPSADADRMFNKWKKIVMADDDLLIPALRHTFTNMLTAIDRDRRRNSPRTYRTFSSETVQREVRQVVADVVQMALMNLTLPNGKLLRDAKFKDCAKAGGWFAKIAKMGKPDQVVGRTISEAQLRKVAF